jgi:hypothetical protein
MGKKMNWTRVQKEARVRRSGAKTVGHGEVSAARQI